RAQARAFQRSTLLFKGGFEGQLDLVGLLASQRALLGTELAQVLHRLGERGIAAQLSHLPLLQRGFILHRIEGRQRLFANSLQILHTCSSKTKKLQSTQRDGSSAVPPRLQPPCGYHSGQQPVFWLMAFPYIVG